MQRFLAFALVLFSSTPAFAMSELISDTDAKPSPDHPTEPRPGFGARVGGYGFRDHDGKWTDCRMNGLGLFGTLDFGKYAFAELGLDSYQSVKSDREEMDRVSYLGTVAGGLRMFPDFVLTPYVQVGGGMEWTRVEIAGAKTSGVYPVGFLGLGAEINVLRSLKAGAVIRALVMAHPTHDEPSDIVYVQGKKTEMEMSPSSQAQFYIRYAP